MAAPRGNVLRVAYSSLSDIPDLLSPHTSSFHEHPTPRAPTPQALTSRAATPRALTPRAATPQALTPRAPTPNDGSSLQPPEAINHWDRSAAHGDSVEGTKIPQPYSGFGDPDSPLQEGADTSLLSGEDLIKVTRMISLCTRNFRRRARQAAYPASKLSALRSRHFKNLLGGLAVTTNAPSSGYYRKLYLGCVPHALVCLDFVLEHVRLKRRAATKQLLDDKLNHLELDVVQLEITTLKCVNIPAAY